MATYLENEILVTNDSVIEYTFHRHGKVTVGKSTKKGHDGTYTFLDANGEDTIYGNACRYRHKQDAISRIKSDIRECIIENKQVHKLYVDGIEKIAFVKVFDQTIF